MFDMSWGEIMVIGGVALIVIGPKDLPKALRTVGQMTAKVRRMASEFQGQFSEAMREAELQDVRKEVEGLNRDVTAATTAAFNPLQTIREEIKGAVEAKPAEPTGSAEPNGSAVPNGSAEPDIWGTNPGPVDAPPSAASPAPAYEDVGPIPHIMPATPALPEPHEAFPETQPLVPLPLMPPAAASNEPVRPRESAA